MLTYISNSTHYKEVLSRVQSVKHMFWIGTADIKDLYVDVGKDGSKRLADNTLVALTLMIAESKTEEKDVMVKVVVNLINQRNE